jgi:hypothetical protein
MICYKIDADNLKSLHLCDIFITGEVPKFSKVFVFGFDLEADFTLAEVVIVDSIAYILSAMVIIAF